MRLESYHAVKFSEYFEIFVNLAAFKKKVLYMLIIVTGKVS